MPDVLAWNDNPNNAIGTEYIIMGRAPGVLLHDRWSTMSGKQYVGCVRSFAQLTQQMASLRFPAYGSLCLGDVPVETPRMIDLGDVYFIGPHCGRGYWPVVAGDVRNYDREQRDQGPCTFHACAYEHEHSN